MGQQRLLKVVAKIAGVVYRIRWLLWCCAGVAAVSLATAILGAGASEGVVLVALIALLWSVFLLALAHAFHGGVPTVQSADPWGRRVRTRLQRAALWCLAVVAVVLSAGLGYLTLRSIGIVMG